MASSCALNAFFVLCISTHAFGFVRFSVV